MSDVAEKIRQIFQSYTRKRKWWTYKDDFSILEEEVLAAVASANASHEQALKQHKQALKHCQVTRRELEKELIEEIRELEQQISNLKEEAKDRELWHKAVDAQIEADVKKVKQRLSEIREHFASFPNLAEDKYVKLMKFYKFEDAKKRIKKIILDDKDKVRINYIQEVITWFEKHKKLLDGGEQQ